MSKNTYRELVQKDYCNPIVAKKYYDDFFHNDIFLRDSENFVGEFISELPSTGLIFDLGCGNGQHSVYISKIKSNCEIIGIDFSRTMLEYAEQEKEKANLCNLKFICDDIISFCKTTNYNPVGILAVFSFTCLTAIEIKEVLNSIYKILLPNGKIFIAVHEDLQTTSSSMGRYEIVPEIYDESETQFYKYFKENEMIKYLEDAKFNSVVVKRLHTNRITEINNEKICFIGQKLNYKTSGG